MSCFRRVGSCVLGFALVGLLAGADWPQFRGVRGSGKSAERNLPTTWSDGTNIAWRAELPGAGASSPITSGNKIFVTGYSGYGQDQESRGDQSALKLHVTCLDRAGGKVLWDRTVDAREPDEEYQGFVALHGYASGTPATDGAAVYAFFGKSGVVAFDFQGNQLWHVDVGSKTHGFGSGSSPVLFGDLVIVNAFVESGSLVALDKKTGREVWRAGDIPEAWNTPCLVDVPTGGQELVLCTEGNLVAFNPASGERLWTCRAIDDYICPSVISHDGIVYAIGGRSGTAVAVRAGGRGEVTDSHLLWKTNKGSNVSSPVYDGGYLYFAHEGNGIAFCLDAKDGNVVYQQRLQPRPDRIYASPLAADGKLYYVSRTAGTYVLPLGPKFELLAHNVLENDPSVFNGSPVPSRGQLLLRSDRYLYCLGHQGNS